MNWIKNKLKILIPLTIVIFGLEFGAGLLLHNPNPVKRNFSEYSKAELDKSPSFIHDLIRNINSIKLKSTS